MTDATASRPLSPVTRALRHRVDDAGARPAVTPLYRTSAYEADSPFFYHRKSNPNVAELEEAVATLEGARHGVVVASGMAAVDLALDRLPAGGALVINRLVYGCTYRLCQTLGARRGWRVLALDLADPEQWRRMPDGTGLVLFETPTNPFLQTVPIRPLAEFVHVRHPGALVVVDNTWATPLCQQPLALGADMSLHSGTKYLSGHSDAMSGLLLTDRDDLAEALRADRFYRGAVLAPEVAWLTRRSLQTLPVRLAAQGAATRRIVAFLESRPEVERVWYPLVDGEQLRDYGALIFFRFSTPTMGCYERFRAALTLFGSGTAMAAVTSMVAQPYTGSHASMTPAEKAAIGLDTAVVRLSIGLEDPADLMADLGRALVQSAVGPEGA
ncbi:MAG: PLP-dependent transferase [Magnetococcales bacterium]|nr:PLP-dependent transferase [Magnetococcales bacterium]